MMMRKVLLTLACVAMLCTVAQAGTLFDTLNGPATTGYSAITPTYEYDVATELGVGTKLNTDGWLNNAPANSPASDGLITDVTGGGDVKTWNSNAYTWEANRPNDANWSFDLPAETKVVEMDFLCYFGQNSWSGAGIGSTLNGAGEVWDIEIGIDDYGWVQSRVRGVNWFDLFSGGLLHGWSTGNLEFQLLWDMENHAYKVDGYGNTGNIVSSGWQSIPSSAWGAMPSAYSRTPDELDVISMINAPDNGLITYQVTGLGVAVPEPGTLMLLGMGLMGLVFYGWRRRK